MIACLEYNGSMLVSKVYKLNVFFFDVLFVCKKSKKNETIIIKCMQNDECSHILCESGTMRVVGGSIVTFVTRKKACSSNFVSIVL